MNLPMNLSRYLSAWIRPRIVGACVVWAFVLFGFAAAQSGVGVSPPRFRAAAQPGTTVRGVITADHPAALGSGAAPMDVAVYAEDFLFAPDGDVILMPIGSHPRSLNPWLSLSELAFTFGPQESREIAYAVELPADLEPGSYWGLLFVESAPADRDGRPPQGIAIRSKVRMGHVIYLDVGELELAGEITTVDYRAADGDAPAEVRVGFRNSGNAVMTLRGRVEVRGADGALLRDLHADPQPTFPGFDTTVSFALEEPLAAGEYALLALLDFDGDALVAGEGWVSVP